MGVGGWGQWGSGGEGDGVVADRQDVEYLFICVLTYGGDALVGNCGQVWPPKADQTGIVGPNKSVERLSVFLTCRPRALTGGIWRARVVYGIGVTMGTVARATS